MRQAKQRLFIGVPLPEGLKDHVRSAQALLPESDGLRLIGEAQWHVTVAFLGEVEQDAGEQARRVVEAVSPDLGGDSLLGGFLMLPSAGKTRVVSLQLHDPDRVWASLHEALVGSLVETGVMEREKRPFRPHLTVARLKKPGRVRLKAEAQTVAFAVESVCLYRSELRRDGARYTVLARTMLSR
jgi:2'-5' RNA ligase